MAIDKKRKIEDKIKAIKEMDAKKLAEGLSKCTFPKDTAEFLGIEKPFDKSEKNKADTKEVIKAATEKLTESGKNLTDENLKKANETAISKTIYAAESLLDATGERAAADAKSTKNSKDSRNEMREKMENFVTMGSKKKIAPAEFDKKEHPEMAFVMELLQMVYEMNSKLSNQITNAILDKEFGPKENPSQQAGAPANDKPAETKPEATNPLSSPTDSAKPKDIKEASQTIQEPQVDSTQNKEPEADSDLEEGKGSCP